MKNCVYISLWLISLLRKNLFLFTFLSLSLWYGYNNFYSTAVKTWDPGSEGLVRSAIISNYETNYDVGGLLHLPASTPANPSLTPTTYKSQFGLQYFLFRNFVFNSNFEFHFQIFRIILGILLAALFATYIRKLEKEFNLFVAIFTLSLISYSEWITIYSVNLYWMEFLLFAPFVISATTYQFFKSKNKLIIFYLLLAFSILLKSLCGYEWLSSIVLSSFIPIIYFELKEGIKFTQLIKKLMVVFTFCVFGFLIALLLHFTKGYLYFSDFSDFHHIFARSAMRMMGDEAFEHIEEWRPGWPISAVIYQAIETYFFNTFQYILFNFTQFNLLMISAFILFLNYMIVSIKEFLFIVIILFTAFLASISWGVFAFNHAVTHAGMELILFYIPFNLVLYPYAGYALQRICKEYTKSILNKFKSLY